MSIYVVEAPTYKRVKIGFTGNSAAKRMAALQTGCPERLALRAFFRGSRATESDLHAKFCDAHIHGDWFHLTPRVRAWMDTLPNCVAPGFWKWLQTQVGREDPVGDFASDCLRGCQTSLPQDPDNLRHWRRFIACRGACAEARDALNEAFSEYQRGH